MTLTPAFLDELRARTSLTTLVAKTVKLTKAGRESKGCCPFHQEKTPSFYVNDDKGFYHCFGCSAHGDAIRWLTDQRGLPFIDAVKELAQAAGMEMPALDPRAAQKQEAARGLHDVMADAAAWFTEQLGGIAGAEARALLDRRGITPKTARDFALGFAPDSRGKLKAALSSAGDAMLVEAGMLIQVEGKEPYDRFRGRLMIPIRDPRGRTIAFGGRIIGAKEGGGGEPKYLNSPDTPLFDKGRTLYNLDRAAPAVRKSGRVLVVEGYMDVIALAQAGIAEAVAPLGTALTEAQLERLWRLADVPILCFDGDSAGQKAALRAAHRALPLLNGGKSLAFATLPTGQDPDDLVRERGVSAIEAVIAKAVPQEEKLWNGELASANLESVAGRTALLNRLTQIAGTVQDQSHSKMLRKELLDRFYANFSLKGQLSPERAKRINEAVASANRQPRRDLSYALQRAVLLGLMRYPPVLYICREDIPRVPMDDPYLQDWRYELVKAAEENPELSENMITTIIATTAVAPIEMRCYTRDLAFSFYRRSGDPEEARRDLRHVIEIMVDEHETRTAAILAEQAFQEHFTDQRFREQNDRRREADEVRQKLKDWLEQAAA